MTPWQFRLSTESFYSDWGWLIDFCFECFDELEESVSDDDFERLGIVAKKLNRAASLSEEIAGGKSIETASDVELLIKSYEGYRGSFTILCCTNKATEILDSTLKEHALQDVPSKNFNPKNWTDKSGKLHNKPPLEFIFALAESDPEFFRFFFEKRAQEYQKTMISISDDKGYSILRIAAETNNIALVEYLLSVAGSHYNSMQLKKLINTTDSNLPTYYTTLNDKPSIFASAVMQGQLEMVKLLRKHGGDFSAKGWHDQTVIELAHEFLEAPNEILEILE